MEQNQPQIQTYQQSQQAQQSQAQQPIQPKKKRRIWLWIILGIIILIVIIITVFAVLSSISSRETSLGNYGQSSLGTGTIGEKSIAPESSLGTSEKVSDNSVSGVPASETEAPSSAVADSNLAEQKIIKIGSMTITVDKVDDTVTKVTNVANAKGGFLQSSSVYDGSNGSQYAYVTIKVPVAQFDKTFEEIKKLALIVDQETVSGQDVTEEFVDLQARLKNAKSTEQQYVEILKQASNVDDTLKVTKQLDEIRGTIERYEGQLKYLQNQTDMSTITLTIQEQASKVSDKPWHPLITIKNAAKTWLNTAKAVIDILIWVVIFAVPIIVIIWVIVAVIKAIIRKRRTRKQQTK